MKETIFLIVNRHRVERMTKSLPRSVAHDEIPVKVTIEVKDGAFKPPVIEQSIMINDWRGGIDLEDVQFKGDVITAEEAEVIRQRRLAKMRQILEEQNYRVYGPDELADTGSGEA